MKFILVAESDADILHELVEMRGSKLYLCSGLLILGSLFYEDKANPPHFYIWGDDQKMYAIDGLQGYFDCEVVGYYEGKIK